jgi:hypothetical protein
VAALRVFLETSAYLSAGRNVATFVGIVAQMCHSRLFNVLNALQHLELEKMYGKT